MQQRTQIKPSRMGRCRRISSTSLSLRWGLPQNSWVDGAVAIAPGGGTRGPRFLPRTPSSFPLLCSRLGRRGTSGARLFPAGIRVPLLCLPFSDSRPTALTSCTACDPQVRRIVPTFSTRRPHPRLLQTILNHVAPQKSFTYGVISWAPDGDQLALAVPIEPRRATRPICSGCHRKRPGYDRLPPRRYQFVPLWQIPVFFLYAPRRADCPLCGVTVEEVPWSVGKSPLTIAYRWFLAGWAKRLSWQEVASAFPTSWEAVYRSVQYAVSWGLAWISMEGKPANKSACNRSRFSLKSSHSLTDIVIGCLEP